MTTVDLALEPGTVVDLTVTAPASVDLTVTPPASVNLTLGTIEPIDLDLVAPALIELTVDTAGVPGPPGPPGPAGSPAVTVEALVDMNAYTIVKVMGTGQARPASSLIPGDGEATTGVTTAAARAGEQVPIRTVGAIMLPGGNLPVGPLYLGVDGTFHTSPDTGLFQLRVGYAQTPTLLVVRIDPPIYR